MDIIEPKITLSLDTIRRGIFLFAENFKGAKHFLKNHIGHSFRIS